MIAINITNLEKGDRILIYSAAPKDDCIDAILSGQDYVVIETIVVDGPMTLFLEDGGYTINVTGPIISSDAWIHLTKSREWAVPIDTMKKLALVQKKEMMRHMDIMYGRMLLWPTPVSLISSI